MRDFAEYYQNKEKDELAAKKAARIERYNKYVDEIRELIPKLVDRYAAKPPETYYRVVIGGKKYISWNISYSYNYGCIFMLPDGKLFHVEHWDYYGKTCIFVDYVYVHHINESSEAAQEDFAEWRWCGCGCGFSKRHKELGSLTVNNLHHFFSLDDAFHNQ